MWLLTIKFVSDLKKKIMQYFDDQKYDKQDYTIQPLPAGNYENCHFSNCNFNEVDLARINFTDCVFDDCNLSMVNLVETQLNDVRFNNCKILGVKFEYCTIFLSSLNVCLRNICISFFKLRNQFFFLIFCNKCRNSQSSNHPDYP